jgi:hypothetical protein
MVKPDLTEKWIVENQVKDCVFHELRGNGITIPNFFFKILLTLDLSVAIRFAIIPSTKSLF